MSAWPDVILEFLRAVLAYIGWRTKRESDTTNATKEIRDEFDSAVESGDMGVVHNILSDPKRLRDRKAKSGSGS